MRVLLVEDDLTTARGISLMLKANGAVVDHADRGEEGLEMARHYDYDVVVLELMLPDMDGYELVRRMRARGLAVPALALTAFTRPEDRDHALQAGFEAYVAKPLEAGALVAAISSLLCAPA